MQCMLAWRLRFIASKVVEMTQFNRSSFLYYFLTFFEFLSRPTSEKLNECVEKNGEGARR